MITEKRIFTIFGKNHEATIRIPETNEEYNAYYNAVSEASKTESDAAVFSARARYFDDWIESIQGKDKGKIPDYQKSTIMLKIYESTYVTEKN